MVFILVKLVSWGSRFFGERVLYIGIVSYLIFRRSLVLFGLKVVSLFVLFSFWSRWIVRITGYRRIVVLFSSFGVRVSRSLVVFGRGRESEISRRKS